MLYTYMIYYNMLYHNTLTLTLSFHPICAPALSTDAVLFAPHRPEGPESRHEALGWRFGEGGQGASAEGTEGAGQQRAAAEGAGAQLNAANSCTKILDFRGFDSS